MFRFAVKAGLAGGAVYYTNQEGIWKENTDKVYERYSNALQPHLTSIKQQIPFEVPALPKSGELCFVTTHYYNQGVKNTIYFIHRIPCYLGQWTKKATDAVKKALDQPNAPTESAASPATTPSKK